MTSFSQSSSCLSTGWLLSHCQHAVRSIQVLGNGVYMQVTARDAVLVATAQPITKDLADSVAHTVAIHSKTFPKRRSAPHNTCLLPLYQVHTVDCCILQALSVKSPAQCTVTTALCRLLVVTKAQLMAEVLWDVVLRRGGVLCAVMPPLGSLLACMQAQMLCSATAADSSNDMLQCAVVGIRNSVCMCISPALGHIDVKLLLTSKCIKAMSAS